MFNIFRCLYIIELLIIVDYFNNTILLIVGYFNYTILIITDYFNQEFLIKTESIPSLIHVSMSDPQYRL